MPEEKPNQPPQETPPPNQPSPDPNSEDEDNADALGADDDQGGHAVVHSNDSQSDDSATIKRVNMMLIVMAVVGLVITLGAIFFLFTTFESGEPLPEEEVDKSFNIDLSGNTFYYQSGESASATLTQIGETNESQDYSPEVTGMLTASSENRNPTWQIDREGGTIAYQISGSNKVSVHSSSGTVAAFEDQSGDLLDWVLTADGRYVFGLFSGNKLVRFDTADSGNTVVDDDFTFNGTKGDGRLFYGQDGTIRWFYFAGGDSLYEILHEVKNGVANDPIEIKSPRFPDTANIERGSMSPDGTLLMFSFKFEGDDYLGQVSLNSRTVRTVYQATGGSSIDSFVWSPDSRTVAISESQGGKVVRLVRLDTGPITSQVLVDSKSEGLNSTSGNIISDVSWLANGSAASFINGGSMFTITKDGETLTKVIETAPTLSEFDSYGWIFLAEDEAQ